jgi:hypothetical protein
MGENSRRITHGWYKALVARRVFYFMLEEDREVALEKLSGEQVSWRHAWKTRDSEVRVAVTQEVVE